MLKLKAKSVFEFGQSEFIRRQRVSRKSSQKIWFLQSIRMLIEVKNIHWKHCHASMKERWTSKNYESATSPCHVVCSFTFFYYQLLQEQLMDVYICKTVWKSLPSKKFLLTVMKASYVKYIKNGANIMYVKYWQCFWKKLSHHEIMISSNEIKSAFYEQCWKSAEGLVNFVS